MADSNQVETDPRLEKRTLRRFSGAEKKRLLAGSDTLPYAEKGAWLRRNGLYAGQLSTWRKELAQHGMYGLEAKAPGRKPVDSHDREIEKLKRANVKLECRAQVDEQLLELQKKVFQLVDSDIASMPMGYQTLVGDRGASLSGGQKQRVLLARALYRRPRLLLLDEATSHLDVTTQRRVNHSIKQLAVTRIVAAHRPETIASADRVLVMEGGRVVDEYRPGYDHSPTFNTAPTPMNAGTAL